MTKVTMCGCDLHDVAMVLRVAVDRGEPVTKRFPTAKPEEAIAWIKEYAASRGAVRIVWAYEASGQGFGLYDALKKAGVECYVLAPTHLPHSSHTRKNKTDEKDAQLILDEVRAFVLAGRKLPAVWIPDERTRDDREIVRMRLSMAEQRTAIKNQISNLLKRAKLAWPDWARKGGEWSKRKLRWLRDLATEASGAAEPGVRTALLTLLAMYEEANRQVKLLDVAVVKLARQERYALPFRRLTWMVGVGKLSAMVFLTEIGDLGRFKNRRQLAAYLGLAPAAFESGERNDRKGRITRQGPARVRHVLCQAAWASLRGEDQRAAYEKLKRGSPKRGKIAIVAMMRRLAIRMWHAASSTDVDEIFKEIDEQKEAAAEARKQKAAAAAERRKNRPSHTRRATTACPA